MHPSKGGLLQSAKQGRGLRGNGHGGAQRTCVRACVRGDRRGDAQPAAPHKHARNTHGRAKDGCRAPSRALHAQCVQACARALLPACGAPCAGTEEQYPALGSRPGGARRPCQGAAPQPAGTPSPPAAAAGLARAAGGRGWQARPPAWPRGAAGGLAAPVEEGTLLCGSPPLALVPISGHGPALGRGRRARPAVLGRRRRRHRRDRRKRRGQLGEGAVGWRRGRGVCGLGAAERGPLGPGGFRDLRHGLGRRAVVGQRDLVHACSG